MAEALRDAYADLFLIDEKLSSKDREAIVGKFKSTHGSNDNIARLQASTFLSFLELADLDAGNHPPPAPVEEVKVAKATEHALPIVPNSKRHVDLRYTIEVHLPPSKDPEVFNAIFKSMKQHLLDE